MRGIGQPVELPKNQFAAHFIVAQWCVRRGKVPSTRQLRAKFGVSMHTAQAWRRAILIYLLPTKTPVVRKREVKGVGLPAPAPLRLADLMKRIKHA
jgi:hypothetical protein